MAKIRRIRDFQHSFSFSSQEEQFDTFYARFLDGDLGRIYIAVPWDGLVVALGLGESKKGPSAIFSPKGKLALMFLKNPWRSAGACRPAHCKERHSQNKIRKTDGRGMPGRQKTI